jgi:hypothetical protein
MTHQEFDAASRRVDLWVFVTAVTVMLLVSCFELKLIDRTGPYLDEFANGLNNRVGKDTASLILAVIGSLAWGLPLLLLGMPAVHWVDRRMGLRCPACGQSVTPSKRALQIGRTGRCVKCQEQLFDPADYRRLQQARIDGMPRRIGIILLGWAICSWGFLLLTLIPPNWVAADYAEGLEVFQQVFLAWVVFSAFVITLASIWGSLRTRRRSYLTALALAAALAPIAVCRMYWFR